MSAVGSGFDVGLHPGSSWNNPEPEIVLVINSKGKVVGAAMGNDARPEATRGADRARVANRAGASGSNDATAVVSRCADHA